MSKGLELKIEEAYNWAVNSEKYIQKLKLEVAHLMHIQEDMKKTIREDDFVFVKAATWTGARSRSKKQQ